MPRELLWKFALIFAIVGWAAWYVYPPQERINLGLDLRGGTHIVMRVNKESAVAYERDLTLARLAQALKEAEIRYEGIVPVAPGTLEIRGVDPAKRDALDELLRNQLGGWEVSRSGDVWRLTMSPQMRQFIESDAIEKTIATIRNRIDELGVREPIVQQQGIAGDRILIQLPGVEDPEHAKDILQDPAILEWKEVSYPPGVTSYESWIPPSDRDQVIALFGGSLPDDTELVPQRFPNPDGTTTTVWWPLKRAAVVVGSDLRDARRNQDEFAQPVVSFELTPEAARRFSVATRENVGRKMAIVLGSQRRKEVISAPVIRSEIRDRGQIEGGFTVQSADDLALKLRSGSIPTEVEIIEERTIGPSLGHDSIRAGVTAALAGFAGVLLFMVAYYRLSGVNAVVALLLNVLLVLGAMGYFGATLTLPGIAGLILTVGMAVDSNVLIFERIREELRIGKTVRAAVDEGFRRAFATILDCNVTTLVAAFFLFSYGTGPVKGFAVTLTIGLTASMFTAVFVSRQLFELVLAGKRRVRSLSI